MKHGTEKKSTKLEFKQNAKITICLEKYRYAFDTKQHQQHISYKIVSLHWLPIKFRIEFKVLLLMYNGRGTLHLRVDLKLSLFIKTYSSLWFRLD